MLASFAEIGSMVDNWYVGGNLGGGRDHISEETIRSLLPLTVFFWQLSILFFRWMGEKFDGVRACWNPNTRFMYHNGIVPTRSFLTPRKIFKTGKRVEIA